MNSIDRIDEVTGKPVLTERSKERVAQLIKGLRGLADFYEEHPEFPPPYSDFRAAVYPDTKNELKACVRAAGNLEKENEKDSDWLRLKKVFSTEVVLGVSIYKSATCERVKVGTKVVPKEAAKYVPAVEEKTVDVYEWSCTDSIFAPDKTDASA